MGLALSSGFLGEAMEHKSTPLGCEPRRDKHESNENACRSHCRLLLYAGMSEQWQVPCMVVGGAIETTDNLFLDDAEMVNRLLSSLE